MFKAISYLCSVIKNPGYKDFIDMGHGIDARYKRSNKYWDRHLSLCKEFETKALESYSSKGRIAVLGAGSLLDINLRLLRDKFSEVLLYDANPSLKTHWAKSLKGSGLKTSHHIVDLTGCLEVWTKALMILFFRSNKGADVAEFISTLEAPQDVVINQKVDVVFSVNLLSQIPIYWRDRVGKILKKYGNIDSDDNGIYEAKLQRALELSMQKLQEQHLKILSESGAKVIVLITDSEFLYYLDSSSHWQSEKALFIPNDLQIKNYNVSQTDSWFWHIAPQGIESKEYGCIHNVNAKAFEISQ